jgi:hypothetical protein
MSGQSTRRRRLTDVAVWIAVRDDFPLRKAMKNEVRQK